MLNSNRERLLAVLLLGVLAIGAGKGIVSRSLIAPIVAKQNEISERKESIEQTEFDIRRLEVVRRDLENLRSGCLPVEAAKANVVYQDRLIQLCELAGLKNAVVSPLQGIDIPNVGRKVSFSVQAECASATVARMVDLLENDSIANRISVISIDRLDQDRTRTTLNVEVLAIADESSSKTVVAPTKPPATSPLQMTFSKNDPFYRGYDGGKKTIQRPEQFVKKQPALAPTQRPKPPPIDARQFVRLIALVEYDGETLAWLYDSRSGKESQYKTNDTIQLDDWSARIVSAKDDTLVIEVDGVQRTLRLGSTLDNTKG